MCHTFRLTSVYSSFKPNKPYAEHHRDYVSLLEGLQINEHAPNRGGGGKKTPSKLRRTPSRPWTMQRRPASTSWSLCPSPYCLSWRLLRTTINSLSPCQHDTTSGRPEPAYVLRLLRATEDHVDLRVLHVSPGTLSPGLPQVESRSQLPTSPKPHKPYTPGWNPLPGDRASTQRTDATGRCDQVLITDKEADTHVKSHSTMTVRPTQQV